MSPRSTETLAVYVRQRAFRKVMRGYDPAEVDEHLERIAHMVSTGAVADLAREQEERLQLREAAIEAAEARARALVNQAEHELHAARMEADATIKGATAKARRIEQEAAQQLEQARLEAEATEIIRQAREEATAIVETARTEGLKTIQQELDEYVERRRREADRLVEAARRATDTAQGEP